jgi:hypothetical protein
VLLRRNRFQAPARFFAPMFPPAPPPPPAYGWWGSDGLLRQLEIDGSGPSDTPTALTWHQQLTVVLSDFGRAVSITPPPS